MAQCYIGRQHGRGPEEESGPHGRVGVPSHRKEEDFYISLHPGSLIPPTGGRERGEENVWDMNSHPHSLIHLSLKTYFPKYRHLEIC